MLESYFDGQLGQEDMKRLSNHCLFCDECKKRLAVLNNVSEYLKACHCSAPDPKVFDDVWAYVEGRLVRDQLSLKEYFRNVWEKMYVYTRLFARPVLAFLFILAIIMVPFMEKRIPQEVYALDTQIKKIEATRNVMVLKSKQKQWTIIWIVPMMDTGGVENEN
jgi:hypothetical protein